MKMTQKESEKVGWDQMRTSPGGNIAAVASQNRALSKLLVFLILFVSVTYVVYTLKLVSSSSRGCEDEPMFSSTHNRLSLRQSSNTTDIASESPEIQNRTANAPVAVEATETYPKTELKDIVFGIAASAKLWDHRKNYIKLWWKPNEMRGVVWLDSPVKTRRGEGLPQLRISGDTSKFKFTNREGLQLAIRISRIVSETFRVGMKNVRWFVMGDDDTVFVTDNLLRVLSKYDHNQYYYVGGQSESHLQNIYFSYSMAFGGGGFAISYPLAKALEKMQDRCLQRYPGLFASDDRIQACMAELGVPLTREPGFHQCDVFGNLLGLLGAHPVAPLVSLHHLDVVEPIFPNMTRVEALQRLKIPMRLDSAALIQQSICYDSEKKWTVSVSWGFVIQVFRGVLSPREIEMPSRTFLNWYKRADFTAYSFNTRPVSRNPCQKPFVFYLSRARLNSPKNQTVSEYSRHRVPHPDCRWKMPDPADVEKVMVFKKPDPHLWETAPRRNCCRVVKTRRRRNMVVDVGMCREGEVSEIH